VDSSLFTEGDDNINIKNADPDYGESKIYDALGGDDVINAGDANDYIRMGAGDDEVRGKKGDDTIYGDAGDDKLVGGDGADYLNGGTGDDELRGDKGDDILAGGDGFDTIIGGGGTDTVILQGEQEEYSWTKDAGGNVTIVDSVEGRDGTNYLEDVEVVRFHSGEPDQEDVLIQDFLDDPLTANFRFNDDDGTYTYNTGGEVKDQAQFIGDARIEDGQLVLDGEGDYLKITSSTDINLDNVTQRTVSFWFQTEQDEGRMMIYEEGGAEKGLNIYIDNGQLYVGAYNQDAEEIQGGWLDAVDENGDSFNVADGQWHNIVVTLDGDQDIADNALTGYLDGQNFGHIDGVALGVHPDPAGIGGVNESSLLHTGEEVGEGMYFKGNIDDARIYSSALDEEAIQEIYKTPPDGIAAEVALQEQEDIVDLAQSLPTIDSEVSPVPVEDSNNLDQFIVSDSGINGNEQGNEAMDAFVVSDSGQENEEIPAMDIIDDTGDDAAPVEPEDVGLGAEDAAIPEDIQEPINLPDENVMA